MVLLKTKRTKENSERALDISNKKANEAFKYVANLEVEVGTSSERNHNPGITNMIF